MIFRDLDTDEKVEQFQSAARLRFSAARDADGKLELDLHLWHPVFLRQIALSLTIWADQRMALASAPDEDDPEGGAA